MSLFRPPLCGTLLTLSSLIALCAPAAQAGTSTQLTVSVQSVSVNAGSSGTLDIQLFVAGSVNLANFQVQLTLPVGNGLTFSGATNATGVPYVFSSSGGYSSLVSPSTTLTVSDFTPAPSGQLVSSGTYGLAHVTFFAASNATLGPQTAALVTAGNSTVFHDSIGSTIPYFPVNGTITVLAATGAPEPSSLGFVALSMVALSGIRRTRRRTAPAPV